MSLRVFSFCALEQGIFILFKKRLKDWGGLLLVSDSHVEADSDKKRE